MKIIISPAKKMEECQDIFEPGCLPEYIDRTTILYEKLKNMSEAELQKVFKANDQITHQNFERYRNMDLNRAQTPALLAYVGIQYQYMAPKLFSYEQWEYVKEHLRILSGFYGILKPDDRVTPYRLEMQAKLAVDGGKDLYEFWGRSLYETLTAGSDDSAGQGQSISSSSSAVQDLSIGLNGSAHQDQSISLDSSAPQVQNKSGRKSCAAFAKSTIINLASKEYSKVIEPFLTEQDRYITCIFGVRQNGKIKVKATEAKMARGEMVRFMAEKNILNAEDIKAFDRLGYRYSEEDSDENTFVYIK